MMKYEFENIAGIEVTDEMYETIEKMYMSSNLSKADFIGMLNLKNIKKSDQVKKPELVRIGVDRTCSGTVIGYLAEVIDISIATGKTIVKKVSEIKVDGWTYCDMWECDVIVK